MFSEILPTTMRVSKPTVRYLDPEYVARPRHILLKPFQGQPKKYAKRVYRLPEVSIKKSSIPNAGFGLYIRENVSKGQPISIYRRSAVDRRRVGAAAGGWLSTCECCGSTACRCGGLRLARPGPHPRHGGRGGRPAGHRIDGCVGAGHSDHLPVQ